MVNPEGDVIPCLPYGTEALKVSFIIDVLRAALLLLSIIHLLSIEHTVILHHQIRLQIVKDPPIGGLSLIN